MGLTPLSLQKLAFLIHFNEIIEKKNLSRWKEQSLFYKLTHIATQVQVQGKSEDMLSIQQFSPRSF